MGRAAACPLQPEEPCPPPHPHWLGQRKGTAQGTDSPGATFRQLGEGAGAAGPGPLPSLSHVWGPGGPAHRPGAARPTPQIGAQLQDGPPGGRQNAQEVQSQAERKEAGARGEEDLPGARAHQIQDHRLRVQGAGGATAGDRPQRVAGQQHHHVLPPHQPAVQHHLRVLYRGDVPDHGCWQHYYWYDERGKKVKCTAPQYVDFVMSSVQKLVTDEDVFPTKYGREFPPSFEALVKKICRYLFHVLAHIYSSHFKETLALELQAHLNTLYAHFILFVREFNLLDPKETAVLDDLTGLLCSGAGAAGTGAAAAAHNHVKER
ncbi:MOB kinase activator 2 isoform X2 [Echinops telfairi]|uniref:MOB kinase activator 2 isoform X2 n=1 Tax=Echinops telfairi TaxID=9371 RepID=A0AC55D3Q8_ECHTE|nr:MOB kinase activator 2 isoform X2 [Echinops telfairi]